MSKVVRVYAALLVAAVLVFPQVAGAVDEVMAQSTSEELQSTTLSESEETESNKANNEDRANRIGAYKDKLTTRVTEFQKSRIAGKCVAAQKITGAMSENIVKVRSARESQYTKIEEKLIALVDRLKVAQVDTTELEAAVLAFGTQADTFLAEVDTFKVTIDDVTAMDCEADPEAFRAALEEAKNKRIELVNGSQELRTYYSETIRPLLENIKIQLAATRNEAEAVNATEDSNQSDEPTTQGGAN